MKSLVTFYSFSGHTDKVARIFKETLKNRGEVDVQRLRPSDEARNFFSQAKAAFTGRRARLGADVKYDVSSYDIVLIGSPVWAFRPTPAINTFLDKVTGLGGKKTVVLLTSGSGAGVGKCFENIRKTLEEKGVSAVSGINISDTKLNDEGFIRSELEKVI